MRMVGTQFHDHDDSSHVHDVDRAVINNVNALMGWLARGSFLRQAAVFDVLAMRLDRRHGRGPIRVAATTHDQACVGTVASGCCGRRAHAHEDEGRCGQVTYGRTVPLPPFHLTATLDLAPPSGSAGVLHVSLPPLMVAGVAAVLLSGLVNTQENKSLSTSLSCAACRAHVGVESQN